MLIIDTDVSHQVVTSTNKSIVFAIEKYPSGERRVVKWWISSYRAVSV